MGIKVVPTDTNLISYEEFDKYGLYIKAYPAFKLGLLAHHCLLPNTFLIVLIS